MRSNLGTVVTVSSMDVVAPEFGDWGNFVTPRPERVYSTCNCRGV